MFGFYPKNPAFCKEYLCSCNLWLQFKFKECLEENAPLCSDIPCDDDFGDFNDVDDEDDEVDRTVQIFNFADVLSFVSLFSSSPNEPLYFVNVTKKGTASENDSAKRNTYFCQPKQYFLRMKFLVHMLNFQKTYILILIPTIF